MVTLDEKLKIHFQLPYIGANLFAMNILYLEVGLRIIFPCYCCEWRDYDVPGVSMVEAGAIVVVVDCCTINNEIMVISS